MMVDIVILCPLAVEFDAVCQLLENPHEERDPVFNQTYEMGYVTSASYRWKVALVETGSRIETLVSVTEKFGHALKPKYLLLTGVAGGIKDVSVGDLVIATKAYGYDSGKETHGGFASRPDAINHPKEILTICRRLARKYNTEKKPCKVIFGPIASGNKVIASTESTTYQIIKKYYNDTIAVEMEAIGFAKVASESGVQFANIRGISDLLDNKSESDKHGSQELASKRAAEFVIGLIRILPKPAERNHKTFKESKKSFRVSYLEDKVAFFDHRFPKKGSISFKREHIELIVKDEIRLIQEIKHVEHIPMPGDLSANWVLVEYRKKDEWCEIYFSTVNPVGLGYWIGGSKQLLKEIENYKARAQITTELSK